MGLFDSIRSAEEPDPDELVLIQLRNAGSCLDKPHLIDFFLYFPTQPAAEQAAASIRPDGFQAEVKRRPESDQWLCFAQKRMIPELKNIQKITREFEILTASLEGEYDGWETGVEK